MAVVSAIVTHNATSARANLGDASLFSGGCIKRVPFSFEVAAADDDTSVFPFAMLPVNARVARITLLNDAITAGTDYDIGVYKADGLALGAVVDKDCLADGLDMSSARTTAVDVSPLVANVGKKLWELAGLSAQPNYPTFLVAFTANTIGSAAGTIGGYLDYIEA